MTISGSDTPTVLIADASPAKREMLAKRLQGQYHVLQADSEEAALALLRSRSGDIVLILLGLTPSGPEGVSPSRTRTMSPLRLRSSSRAASSESAWRTWYWP